MDSDCLDSVSDRAVFRCDTELAHFVTGIAKQDRCLAGKMYFHRRPEKGGVRFLPMRFSCRARLTCPAYQVNCCSIDSGRRRRQTPVGCTLTGVTARAMTAERAANSGQNMSDRVLRDSLPRRAEPCHQSFREWCGSH